MQSNFWNLFSLPGYLKLEERVLWRCHNCKPRRCCRAPFSVCFPAGKIHLLSREIRRFKIQILQRQSFSFRLPSRSLQTKNFRLYRRGPQSKFGKILCILNYFRRLAEHGWTSARRLRWINYFSFVFSSSMWCNHFQTIWFTRVRVSQLVKIDRTTGSDACHMHRKKSKRSIALYK